MESEWGLLTLGQIANNVSRTFTFSKKESVIFINTGDVLRGQFLHKDLVPVKGLPGQAKKAIEQGDILFSEIRPENERFALVDFDAGNYVVSTKFMVIRLIDDSIDLKFFYLLLTNRVTLRELQRIAESRSGTFPQITFDAISYFPFKIPQKSEQKSIAHILGTLDDKIELNRRMNETLESMARALFKSWFVDFDPVIDNALAAGNPIPEPLQARAETRCALGSQRKPLPENTQKLFPDAFVFDEEMGWIPEGWQVACLKSRIDVLNGCAFKSQDYSESGIFVLRTKNFNSENMVERLSDDVFLPDDFIVTNPQHVCEPLDYHLIMVGASVGNRGLIQPHQLPALRNQNMWCFRPIVDLETSRCFVKYMLDSLIVEKIGLASGSARAFFRKGDFQNHRIGFGTPSIQSAFDHMSSPFLIHQCKNNAQSQNLTKLRDTLLPKLLSGELRVPEAMAAAEEALS